MNSVGSKRNTDMSDITTIRLSKVAREFNIGIHTILSFLIKKGIPVENSPNAKISEEVYNVLCQEFQPDKNVKEHSRMKDSFLSEKKTVSIDTEKENTQIQDEILEEKHNKEFLIKDSNINTETPKSVKKKSVPPVEIPEKTPIETPQEQAEEIKIEEKIEVEIEEKTAKEKETKKEIKVIGKMNLDDLNNKSGSDKKTKETGKVKKAKKETKEQIVTTEEEKTPVQEIKKTPIETPIVAKIETIEPKSETEVEITIESETEIDSESETPESIDFLKTKYQKLDGPVILGKMKLPEEKKKEITKKVNPATKAGTDAENNLKKKRKRIKKQFKQVIGEEPTEKFEPKPFLKDKKTAVKRKGDKPEISGEAVDKQIKETLSRLAPAGKSKTAKYRREKRENINLQRIKDHERSEEDKKILKVTEFVTVNELASMMDVSSSEVISACMSLGMFVSINQRLDAETLSIVADEFGFKVEFVTIDAQEAIIEEIDKPEDLIPRPPIITVMGHVDHGKTSLLDYIRKTNVIGDEAGGITQHIGSYEVKLEDGRKMTFLDTPGHEAFTAMRARGAQVTDIAVIIIAADDSVMPQTKEAINHAQAAGVPMVFAINKIDKPGANPEKIKQALAEMNLLIEEWGGKYQCQEISAKKGVNVDVLLEKILLEAELLDLKANPNKKALGTVIESALDKGRGYVAKILVQSGTLKNGDFVLAGCCYGKVKAMYNERNVISKEAGPSTPVLLLGLNGAPQAGDTFHVMTEQEAKSIANKRLQLQREQGLRTRKHITLDEIGRRIAIGDFKELNVIVKGDVDGSVEALADSLLKLSDEQIQVNVIHKSVGQISESDVMLASASDAVIIGFQVRPSLNARKLAEQEHIDIRLYSIIYNAIEELKAAMEGMLSSDIVEKIVCNIEVREVFKITKVGTVAGCIVLDGKIARNTKIRLIRDGIVVYAGALGSLKRFKDDVKDVKSGQECGLNIHNFNDIKIGDIIEGYEETEVKRTLK